VDELAGHVEERDRKRRGHSATPRPLELLPRPIPRVSAVPIYYQDLDGDDIYDAAVPQSR
jgi:hypothetical protein